jgi:hypothetical protein
MTVLIRISTATFFMDINVGVTYAALRCPVHQQEATDVTGMSDRRGRVCHSETVVKTPGLSSPCMME